MKVYLVQYGYDGEAEVFDKRNGDDGADRFADLFVGHVREIELGAFKLPANIPGMRCYEVRLSIEKGLHTCRTEPVKPHIIDMRGHQTCVVPPKVWAYSPAHACSIIAKLSEEHGVPFDPATHKANWNGKVFEIDEASFPVIFDPKKSRFKWKGYGTCL